MEVPRENEIFNFVWCVCNVWFVIKSCLYILCFHWVSTIDGISGSICRFVYVFFSLWVVFARYCLRIWSLFGFNMINVILSGFDVVVSSRRIRIVFCLSVGLTYDRRKTEDRDNCF